MQICIMLGIVLESSDELSKVGDFFILAIDNDGLLSDLGLSDSDMLCSLFERTDLFLILAVLELQLVVSAPPFFECDCRLLVFLIQL